ncbi:MAG: hypothetical protein ACI9WU_001020 [Myxococcota bacterium]
MEFNFPVDQIPRNGKRVEDTLTRAWMGFALGKRMRPLEDETPIALKLERQDTNVTIDGDFLLKYEYDCSRCAEAQQTSIDVGVHLAFVQGDEDADDLVVDGWGLGSGRELVFYKGPIVNAEDAIIEQIVFALPHFPLCRDECAGVCVDCGANQNEKTCDCAEKRVDLRFSQLADLKLGG